MTFAEAMDDDSCLVNLLGEHASYPVNIRYIRELHLLHFSISHYLKVQNPARLPVVCEGIARANYGIYLAKFSLSEDNVILLEVTTPLGRRAPERMPILEMMSTLMIAADTCYPRFSRLIWSDCPVEEVFSDLLGPAADEEAVATEPDDAEDEKDDGETYSPEDGEFLTEV